jgi:hypothetical protein
MSKQPLNTALYLDFDNVLVSLGKVSPPVARAFATDPAVWLSWFELGNHDLLVEPDADPVPRRVLVRRCYGSPWRLKEPYRRGFMSAGFSVIDCPALTSRGKNSADIRMTIEVLEALDHPARYDEFIILSSDADFTPVLIRIREHGRRTAIIASATATAALRGACDCAISEGTFSQDALGMTLYARLHARVAGAVQEILDQSHGTVPLSELHDRLCRSMGHELHESRYCGYGSMAALLASADYGLINLGGNQATVIDPRQHEELAAGAQAA